MQYSDANITSILHVIEDMNLLVHDENFMHVLLYIILRLK